jgi:hypothetical protein
MKTIFFLSFFVLLSLGLMGQSNLSLEISAHGMVTPAPRLGGIGLGQQVRGALNYKMGATGALELFAGYRMQHGYSQKAVTVEERSLPTEYQLIVNSNQLTGFSYLDVGLGYQWSLGNYPALAGRRSRAGSLSNASKRGNLPKLFQCQLVLRFFK